MNQGGFSLIEVLVVIAIIGLMSVLAIGGYSDYRKDVTIDLAGDSLVSQLNELRAQTVYGQIDSVRAEAVRSELNGEVVVPVESPSLCYGASFEKDGDFWDLRQFREDFNDKKVWRGENFVYLGCDGNERPMNFEWDDNIWLQSITVDDQEVTSSLVLRFLPPKGEFELKVDGVLMPAEEIIFKLSYLGEADGQLAVVYNLN